MKKFVIEASVVIKLFFEEEHSDAAVRYVKNARQLLSPSLVWAETANVVWKRLMRKEISAVDARGIVEEILRIPIETSNDVELIPAALLLAAQTGRTVYDCLYPALALREKIPLLTADGRYANSLTASPFGKQVHFVGR